MANTEYLIGWGIFFIIGLLLSGMMQARASARKQPSLHNIQEDKITRESDQKTDKTRLEQSQAILHFGDIRLTLSLDGIHQTNQWSPKIYTILGRNPNCAPFSTNEYIEHCVHPEDKKRVQSRIEKVLSDNGKAELEYRIVCPDGAIKYVFYYLEFISNGPEGKIFFGLIHDISIHKSVETKHIAVAAKLQTFVEQLGGIPYLTNLDKNNSTICISKKIENLLGFSSEQWCSDRELRINQVHPDDRVNVLKAMKEILAIHHPFSIDYRIYTKNGDVRWFHDEARLITNADGTPLFLQGLILDITERKKVQSELERSHCELQKLIAALDSLREEEQKRLAQEMHDELGQLLAAMKMELSIFQQHLSHKDSPSSKSVQQLNNLNELVDTMVISVRRIIADLPPKVVNDLGLFNGLKLMVSTLEKRHQILCRLELPKSEPVLEEKIAIPIYRMVQESLNNVVKHAAATRVDIQIDCYDGHIVLSIVDNGKGISPDKPQKADTFGLIGMRERVIALGGEMKIESADAAGTAIQIVIPIRSI